MGFKKGFAAVLTAVCVTLTGVSAFAATSPSKAPAATNYVDTNKQDHEETTVVSVINTNGTAGTVTKITANSGKNQDATVLKVARNASGKKVPITVVGDGKKGVLASKAGKKVTKVKIASKSKVTVKAYAFKSSKVKKFTIAGKVSIKKNAFKGTGKKNPTIAVQVKKASDVSLAKGAFNGLNSKAKVVVSKSKMSSKEFKKLTKKLKSAGFKGTIVRK